MSRQPHEIVLDDIRTIQNLATGQKTETPSEWIVADIATSCGTVSIDTKRAHCGNCEFRDRQGYCMAFHEELEQDRDWYDDWPIDWLRHDDCLAAQIAVR